MKQKNNTVNCGQSIVSEGVIKGAVEGVLEDLSVQNAEMIKGGPRDRPAGGGGDGGDIIVFDIIGPLAY